ncbi:HCLS1-binding protein 3 [Pelobates fuscus]|uniref:HCLS1-binding protein 3 n=1 Tax=Pelobates fuscus TaxID=191477 RepID=UPI002FE4CD00
MLGSLPPAMAATALVTSRQIQNTHTGLDLWVPEYQEIRGRMMTGHVEYQIVVVTNLSAFKTAKHKPEDVVQFVVFRKYSEIDDFYYKINAHYPKLSLPPFPRKVLFVGESDIRDRRAAFNDIVKAIAKEKELAACPELLEFLGMRPTDFDNLMGEKHHTPQFEDGDFFKKEESSVEALLSIEATKQSKPVAAQQEEDEEEEEEVDFDPLGIIKTKRKKNPTKPKKIEEPNVRPNPTRALFDDEIDPDAGLFVPSKKHPPAGKNSFSASDDIKLFEEQDLGGTVKIGDSLLLPSACSSEHTFKASIDEDVNELFRVDEDLEKLLNIRVKPVPKPKPKIPAKPTFLKETEKSKTPLHPHSEQKEPNIQIMDESDILQYIKENEPADSDSLSLF